VVERNQLLRIVFVTNNYTPYAGGVVSSINAIVPELISSGHHVFIITLDFLGVNHEDPAYVYRIACPIKFRYNNNPMAIPWRMEKQLEEFITLLDPHIVHSHHPWLLGGAAANIARKKGIPLIFTYHTLYEHYAHYVPCPEIFSRPIISYLVKKYCTEATGIIAPSRAVKKQLDDWNLQATSIVMPSPIAPIFFQEEFAPKKCLPNEICNLLLVSRLEKEKNIPFLLQMFAQLHHESPHKFVLRIVGHGSYTSWLKNYAYSILKLPEDRVMFLEKKTAYELLAIYRQADVFVFSSLSDTQGLVLAEALSGGTPVVALDGPGQRDSIRHGVNGFLVNSLAEMMTVIKRIAQDVSLHQELQNNARESSFAYTSKNITQRLSSWYQRFV